MGHLTNKSDTRVRHLNNILTRGRGNLNDPIFKSSNARGLPGGGGMLKFGVDRRVTGRQIGSVCLIYVLHRGLI